MIGVWDGHTPTARSDCYDVDLDHRIGEKFWWQESVLLKHKIVSHWKYKVVVSFCPGTTVLPAYNEVAQCEGRGGKDHCGRGIIHSSFQT